MKEISRAGVVILGGMSPKGSSKGGLEAELVLLRSRIDPVLTWVTSNRKEAEDTDEDESEGTATVSYDCSVVWTLARVEMKVSTKALLPTPTSPRSKKRSEAEERDDDDAAMARLFDPVV